MVTGITWREGREGFATGSFQQVCIISKRHVPIRGDAPVKWDPPMLILPLEPQFIHRNITLLQGH